MELVSICEKVFKPRSWFLMHRHPVNMLKRQVILTAPVYYTMMNIRKSKMSIHYIKDIE